MKWLSKLQMLSFSLLRGCQSLHLEDFVPNGCSEFTSRCYLFLFVWADSCQNRKSDYNGATDSAWGCICTSGNFEYNIPRDENLYKNVEGRNCDFAFGDKMCWWKADGLKQSQPAKLCQISLLLRLVGKWSIQANDSFLEPKINLEQWSKLLGTSQ